jgi:hypothetical protein
VTFYLRSRFGRNGRGSRGSGADGGLFFLSGRRRRGRRSRRLLGDYHNFRRRRRRRLGFATQTAPDLVGIFLLDRAGVRLLFLDSDLGKQLENDTWLDL